MTRPKRPSTPASDVEARLIRSMEQAVAIAEGRAAPAQEYRMSARDFTAAEARPLSREWIASLRKRFELSQAVFARVLNVSAESVRAWEQGKRTPDGAALRLLELTEAHPEWVLEKVTPRANVVAPRTLPAVAQHAKGRFAPEPIAGMDIDVIATAGRHVHMHVSEPKNAGKSFVMAKPRNGGRTIKVRHDISETRQKGKPRD
jgi:putative transcriptional regulator